MCFYKRPTSGQVTAEPSPRSPGLLPRRVRAWIDGVLDLAQDVSHAIDAFAGIARYAVEQVDRSVPPEVEPEPEIHELVRDSVREAVPAARAVVAYEADAAGPCIYCGSTRVEVLVGAQEAQESSTWRPARCAGCGQCTGAKLLPAVDVGRAEPDPKGDA